MSEQRNRELLARYVVEVWDQGNPGALRTFLSPDFRRHMSPHTEPLDLDQQIARIHGLRAAFPDIAISVQDVVAEGDRIAFRSTMCGTHRGSFVGLEPTGRSVTVSLVDLIRVEDGLFAEQWGGPDLFDLLRQVGATYSL